MADVPIEHGRRCGQDVVYRQHHLTANRFNRLRGRAALLRGEELERVQSGGQFAAENLRKLEIVFAEGVQLGTFHVERADDLILNEERDRQRAARPGRSFEEEGIGRRIRTEVAFSRCGHKTCDAIPFRLGVKDAAGSTRSHPFLEERLQPARLRVEQANFDDIVVEQIMREPADVELEHFNSFFHAHLRKLIGTQVGQLSAGLVQGIEFLLLLHFRSDVPGQADQLADLIFSIVNGGNVQVEVAVIVAMKPGGDRFAGQGAVEGTVVWPQDLRGTEGLVKASAEQGTIAPLFERPVGPGDPQVCVDHRHTVRKSFEDALSLKEVFGLGPDERIVGIRVDAIEVFAAQESQSLTGIGDSDQLPARLGALQQVSYRMVGTFQNQDPRSLRHNDSTSSWTATKLRFLPIVLNYRNRLRGSQGIGKSSVVRGS